MTRNQQLALLGGLGAVMAAVYANVLRPSASDGEVAVAAAEPKAVSQVTHTSPAVRQAQQNRFESLTWGRDPFGRDLAGEGVSGLVLSGILWDAQRPVAIINGAMVQVGEELDGYRIVSIGRDAATMSDGAQTFQLQLAP